MGSRQLGPLQSWAATPPSGSPQGTRCKSTLYAVQYLLHDQTGGYSPPVFFRGSQQALRALVIRGKPELTEVVGFIGDRADVALQDIVEQTVAGLGYELVEIERSTGGLLRITIDMPWKAGVQQFVNVEDCEKVTRQLQFALEVEGTEYKRLEVSSPGIDRPLRGEPDFERFAGAIVDITLKAPLGAAAGGQVAVNRKKFRGRLERAPAGGWQIVWSDEPPVPPGRKVSRKREPAPLRALGFALDELKEARLAPIVDFKGRPVGDPAGRIAATGAASPIDRGVVR